MQAKIVAVIALVALLGGLGYALCERGQTQVKLQNAQQATQEAAQGKAALAEGGTKAEAEKAQHRATVQAADRRVQAQERKEDEKTGGATELVPSPEWVCEFNQLIDEANK